MAELGAPVHLALVKAYQAAEPDYRAASIERLGRYTAETNFAPIDRAFALRPARAEAEITSRLEREFNDRLNRAYVGAARGAVAALSCALSLHRVRQFSHRPARFSILADRCREAFRALSQRRVC